MIDELSYNQLMVHGQQLTGGFFGEKFLETSNLYEFEKDFAIAQIADCHAIIFHLLAFHRPTPPTRTRCIENSRNAIRSLRLVE